MLKGSAISKASRSSMGSKSSDKLSWKLSMSRRSVGRVQSSFSLHTRFAKVLAKDRQDAFDPNATAIKVWQQILLLCILVEAFLLPYCTAFQPGAEGTFSIFSVPIIVCETVFTLDLYIQACTGYYSDGNLIRDKKRTVQRYVYSRQFVVDLIALLPVRLLGLLFQQIVPWVLLLKLIRWSRLPLLVSNLDELYSRYFVALKLAKVLASTLYLAHVLACVRYSFGEDTDDTDHWLPGDSLHNHSLHRHRYLVSLFWSVGVMTGLFEGKLPHHNAEFLFTIVVALCGFSLFTTLCATIFVISKCESGNSEAMGARINQLTHVLSFHGVPENQKTQAIEYLKRYYTDTDSNDRDTVKLLCPSIANDIKVELLKATIAQVSLFNGCNDEFLTAMTSLLEMIAVPAQTTLFSAGDYGDAMYVVHSGVFATICDSVIICELRKGSCFGEISVFSSLRRTATVVSTTYAILYKLSRFHCERVLEGYPDCASVICVHVEEIIKRLGVSDDLTNRAPGTTPSSSAMPLDKPRIVKPRRSSATELGVPGVGRVRSRRGSSGMSFAQSGASSIKRFSAPLLQDLSQAISYRTPSPGPSLSPWLGRLTRKVGSERSVVTTTQSLDNSFERPKLPRVYTHHGLWKLLLLRKCIDHQSRARMWWLLALLCNLCYLWFEVPLQVIFPLWQQPSWIAQTVDTISNTILLIDVWMNLNLSFMADSVKILDPKLSAKRYLRGGFVFDVLCFVPFEYLHMKWYGIMRLPHLLRVYHVKTHLNEIQGFITLNSRRQLALLALLFFITFHVVACFYFGISYVEGFDPNEDEAWILPTSLCLRRLNATHLENCDGTMLDERANSSTLQTIGIMEYSRSLYYAVGVLASPGKSVEPSSDVQLVAALVFMLSGFLITGIVVDNVQKRFTASAYEQKQFFETSSRVQLFLRRQKAPLAIHHRTKSFLDYWWASHRGAVIRELLADFPRSMRLELLRSICTPVLQTLALLLGVHPVRCKLEEVLIENAEFILFGQGETVYHHGDYITGLFFLLEGEVCVVKGGGPPAEIPRGGFFGTAVLTQQERGDGYTEHVSAASGCVVLFVSREQLSCMESIFPALKRELIDLERRLANNKLVSKIRAKEDTPNDLQHRAQVLKTSLALLKSTVYDPNSMFVLVWETWVFIVMTTQSVLAIFQACFPLREGHRNADALTVFLEISFVLDIFIRSRLGFYEYGNKIVDLSRIKRGYRRSWTFALDIAALLPLYVINWCIPARERWNLVNINKLLRLFKVPRQLHALETRYLKRTTELHLFKLLYYTFMLSHFLGCIWFNFASKEAVPNWTNHSMPDSKIPTFGQSLWLPPKRLELGSNLLQYMASLYWSFGLMSASSEAQFPTTSAQCLFSVATMISGMFLFAYVIGNFTDVIELTSSESREFNGKMNAVRQMLEHFRISDTVQERVKTFLFFKRFHTITQESMLAQCLPPSLLTDIRLVYLRPMIEQVDFLVGMDITITRVLVSQFTQVLVSRGEFVFRRGDNGSDMFFIFAGVVDVLVPTRGPSHTDNFKFASELSLARKHDQKPAPNKVGPMQDDIGTSAAQENLKKINEMSAGSYFGENSLFTNGQRDAHIQAQTSCILYRLSRESLELVFDRYPRWKQKVLRIATIHREQTRLQQISREEQRRGMPSAIGKLLSRSDIVNERAETMKEKRFYAGLHRSNSGQSYQKRQVAVDQNLFKPVVKFLDNLVHGIPAQGTLHLCWLRFIVCCTLYVCVKIPFQLTIDPMERKTSVVTLVNALGLVCKFVFVLDVWVSWHVKESAASMELYDEKLRSVYMKERMLWDILAAIPLYDLLVVFDCNRWVKLLRCTKMLNVWRYLDELNRHSIASEATRFSHVWVLYLLAMYWAACAYLAVAEYEGFGVEWEAWLPTQKLEIADPQNPSSSQLALRFLRGLFYAMTTFMKKSYNPPPETATLLAFHIGISFIGLMVMSFVIGELASLFISYIGLEVEFRKNSIAVNA